MSTLHAIVLAGGRARRLAGADKVMTVVGGRPLLAHAVGAVAAADRVVVVGPHREVDLPRDVAWTREDPPFAGPAAAVAAGVAAIDPRPDDEILVLPADLVRAAAVVAALGTPASVATDPDGRRQWACVRVRAGDLLDALNSSADVTGLSLHALFGGLELTEVAVTHEDCADLDTPADVKEYADEHP